MTGSNDLIKIFELSVLSKVSRVQFDTQLGIHFIEDQSLIDIEEYTYGFYYHWESDFKFIYTPGIGRKDIFRLQRACKTVTNGMRSFSPFIMAERYLIWTFDDSNVFKKKGFHFYY